MPKGVYLHKTSWNKGKKQWPNGLPQVVKDKISKIAKERGFGKWMIGRKPTKETLCKGQLLGCECLED